MRLLSSSKYAPTLIKMGLTHGKDFDCSQEECRVCLRFREKEIEEVSNMSMEEKGKLSWGVIK